MNKQNEASKRTTLTVQEAATYLGVSNDMIYRFCRQGKIDHFKMGAKIFFIQEKIDEWINDQIESRMEEFHVS